MQVHEPQTGPRSDSSQGAGPASSAAATSDLALIGVIGATFPPVVLLILAVNGGGITAVALAFVVLLLTTALVTTVVRRAVDQSHSYGQ